MGLFNDNYERYHCHEILKIRFHSSMQKMEKGKVGIDPNLKMLLPAAVAFHHAGLTEGEREELEDAYKKDSIRVLVATTTLGMDGSWMHGQKNWKESVQWHFIFFFS